MAMLLPDAIAVVEGPVEDVVGAMPPTEAANVRDAVPRRQREFATGRAMARRCLAMLGGPEVALPADPDGVPVWPAGFTGSITHTADWCASALAHTHDAAAIGIDIERLGRLSPALASRVMTSRERRAMLDAATGQDADIAATVLFSAKEAAFKCWFTPTRRALDWRDIEIHADWRNGVFRARPVARPGFTDQLPSLAGRYAVGRGLVATAVYWPRC